MTRAGEFDPAEVALLHANLPERNARTGGAHTVVIVGPPGSGKSTLARSLAETKWLRPILLCQETHEQNRHLARYRNATGIDFGASQDWFLRQYELCLARSSKERAIVLDQDPRAVVLVYSKMLRDKGWLSEERYRQQLQVCGRILSALSARSTAWSQVHLSAPRPTLTQRLMDRKERSFLTEDIVLELIGRFERLFASLKAYLLEACIEFDTHATTTDEIVASLRRTIRP